MPGVFSETEPSDVVLLWQHDPSKPVGRMTELRDDKDGAHGVFRVADTELGREVLSLTRDGITRGLSVGFEPGQTRNKNGVREHVSARLRETSVVTFAAFPSAEILSVRSKEDHIMEEETPVVEAPAIDLSPIETRLEDQSVELREVRNQLANITTIGQPEVVPPITLHAAFARLLKTVAENPAESRALADVVGDLGTGDASGLIRDKWVSELIGYINAARPMFSAAGTLAFPDSGYGVAFPKITQQALVGPRGAEKAEVPSRAVIVSPVNFPMAWFAGAVDVALELIAQSDPSVVEVVVGSLLDSYAIATEQAFVDDAEAAGTAAAAPLDFTTWAAFSTGMVVGAGVVRTATGLPGNLLALKTASWINLMKLLSPAAPASLPGPQPPDFAAESVNLYGITMFHSPLSDADLQFNTKSLRKAERPPEQVTASNVALMGRDIGVLGATICLPLYPAGIIRYGAA